MMGKGIDLAAIDSPEHAQAIDDMKDQLLIALVRRLNFKVELPVAEIDDTEQFVMMMHLDVVKRSFTFEVRKKQ